MAAWCRRTLTAASGDTARLRRDEADGGDTRPRVCRLARLDDESADQPPEHGIARASLPHLALGPHRAVPHACLAGPCGVVASDEARRITGGIYTADSGYTAFKSQIDLASVFQR